MKAWGVINPECRVKVKPTVEKVLWRVACVHIHNPWFMQPIFVCIHAFMCLCRWCAIMVYLLYYFTVLEVSGADGLVSETISWMAKRSLSRCRGLLMPISRWISVSDRADMMAPLFTLARQAATYHAGIPTQSWGESSRYQTSPVFAQLEQISDAIARQAVIFIFENTVLHLQKMW